MSPPAARTREDIWGQRRGCCPQQMSDGGGRDGGGFHGNTPHQFLHSTRHARGRRRRSGCHLPTLTACVALRASQAAFRGVYGQHKAAHPGNLSGDWLGGDGEEGYQGENRDGGAHGLPKMPRAKRSGSHSYRLPLPSTTITTSSRGTLVPHGYSAALCQPLLPQWSHIISHDWGSYHHWWVWKLASASSLVPPKGTGWFIV